MAKKFAHRPYPLASDDERFAQGIAQAVTRHARTGKPLVIWVVATSEDAERLVAHKIRESLCEAGIARNRPTFRKRGRAAGRAPSHAMRLIPDITTGIVADDLFTRGDQPVFPFRLTIVGVGNAAVPIMEALLQRERALAPSEPSNHEVMATILQLVTIPRSCQALLKMAGESVIFRNKIHHKLYRSGSLYERFAVGLVKDYMEHHSLKHNDLFSQDHFASVKACFGGDHELWKKWLLADGFLLLGERAVVPHLCAEFPEACKDAPAYSYGQPAIGRFALPASI